MKSIICLSLLLAMLPQFGCSDAPAEQVGINSENPIALRILPLGDSITQANSTQLSYRYWLWMLLEEQKTTADFVGTQNTNFEGEPDYPTAANGIDTFDRNHQGHWGWRTEQILAELPQWLQSYQADVALVHLGTNDCLQNQPVPQTLEELEQIVLLLRQDNPDIDVAFSPLGPTTWPGAECLTHFNEGLALLADRLNTDTSHVLLASAEQALDLNLHLYDGLHPNAAGEQVIAAMWLKAINNFID